MKINDNVKGKYFGVAFEGVISGYDSNRIYVDFNTPVLVFGTLRTSAAVDMVCIEKHSFVEFVSTGESVECATNYEIGGVTAKVK